MAAHRPLNWIAWTSLLLVVLCSASHARAAEPPARVSVLTMGPGEHPFTRFGHNAILLEWDAAAKHESAVYNFGTFDFDGARGVADFMAGRFRYWLSVSSLESTLGTYGDAQRSVTQQELDLTQAERANLYTTLEANALPEHRYYDYDYYRDNCSTRVRDALDRLLDGELRRQLSGNARLSFRQHTLRLVGDDLLLYFGLDLALGAPTDRAIARWDELFLPQELHDGLAHATRDRGVRRLPLVRAERQLLSAKRARPPQVPPERREAYAASGSLIGLLLAVLGLGASKLRGLRIAFGLMTAALGAVVAVLGVALPIFWTSRHWAAHDNPHVLACPPWALALPVLGLAVCFGKVGAAVPLRRLLGASLLATCTLLLLSLTAAGRESQRVALLFVPLWAGWLCGARLSSRGRPSASRA